MEDSPNLPKTQFYSSPMKLFVVALLSSLKNIDNSTSKLVFRPLVHQPRIYAGAPAGVHVTTVHAYDPDRPRKKVEYNLPNVLDYKHFVVDKLSGNISTAMPINKTIGDTYQVMVAAVSSGSSQLEHLQIAVTEFNQFPPRFEQRAYQLDLHPSMEVDSVVLRVRALDPDPAPHNAEVYYKLDQNASSSFFSLDPLTGELSLGQPLNDSLGDFGIFAEDGGSPKRWDYVPVMVTIKTISAPRNVRVSEVGPHSVFVCWEPPLYDVPSGYIISYGNETRQELNVTGSGSDLCQGLKELQDDTDYQLQIYGWKEADTGQKSDVFYFQTPVDWCSRAPCNDGVCSPLPSDPWFSCECFPGYHGPRCEHFDACSREPCGNNGRCLNTSHGDYVCVCADDYSGPDCGDYAPCERRPCRNGGTCQPTTHKGYVCECARGFYGDKCAFRDPCVDSPCRNQGLCNATKDGNFRCDCAPGYTGEFCETETDECSSSPCMFGATCIKKKGSYSCICTLGYSGPKCEKSVQCPADKTDTERGMFYWNLTNHNTEVVVPCPFGAVESNELAFAYRSCILENDLAVWGEVNTTECKGKGFLVADELADELHSITKDPASLNTETLEAAAQGIETISTYAVQDKQLAIGMVKVISNLMEVNDTVVRQDENNTFTAFSKNLRQIVDDFASNVELKPGESLDVSAENVRIQSMEWYPDVENDTHLELSANHLSTPTPTASSAITTTPDNNIPVPTYPPERQPKVPLVKVFVPKEALQEAHRQLDGNVRVKFIVFYNDKLFQSKQKPSEEKPKPKEESKHPEEVKTSKEIVPEAEFKAPVLQISVGNISLKNMNKPLIYVLPIVTKKDVLCVYWDEDEEEWSSNGLTTNHTKNYVICQSSHMTAFSVLLDLSPRSPKDAIHESILSIISYVGCILSIIGLTLTIITYLLFGCLNRDHPGKILAHLCFSLLLMNGVFLVEAFNPPLGGHLCACVSMMLHYLVLTSLSWMCVEAINMYQLLVHVFASAETHFMLKRCICAWGGPLLIVVSTATCELGAYYDGLKDCMLSPRNPWIYYCAFLVPCCILLLANAAVFVLVSRVLFKRRPSSRATVGAAQIRGAATVCVLLGVTWVLGPLAVGRAKLAFQYAFCVANSVQGFLIFLVRCLLYPEARAAWMHLLRTGRLKQTRGAIPVSFCAPQQKSSGVSVVMDISRNGNADKSQSVSKSSQEPPSVIELEVSNKTPDEQKTPRNAYPFQKENEKPRRGTFNHFEKNPEQIENYLNKKNGRLQMMTCPNFQDTSFVPYAPTDGDRTPKRFKNEPSRLSLMSIKKRKSRLPYIEKNAAGKDRRSASIDVVLDTNHRDDYGAMDGFRSFFANRKLRSVTDPGSKDKRSLSLSNTSEAVKKEAAAKKEKGGCKAFKAHSSIMLEQEEDRTDDDCSTSTDVEDSPPASTAPARGGTRKHLG